MIVISILPVLTMFVGGLVYTATTTAKAVEVGRIMFACGLLVTLAVFAGHVLKLGF